MCLAHLVTWPHARWGHLCFILGPDTLAATFLICYCWALPGFFFVWTKQALKSIVSISMINVGNWSRGSKNSVKLPNYWNLILLLFLDAVKEDMQVVGVRVEDTKNRLKWKTVIRCGNPWKGRSRKEKKNYWNVIIKALSTTHLTWCLWFLVDWISL